MKLTKKIIDTEFKIEQLGSEVLLQQTRNGQIGYSIQGMYIKEKQLPELAKLIDEYELRKQKEKGSLKAK